MDRTPEARFPGCHLDPEESAYSVGTLAPGCKRLTHPPASTGQGSTLFNRKRWLLLDLVPQKDAKVPLSPSSQELLSTGSEDVPGQPFFRPSSISSSSSSGRSWSRPWRPTSWWVPAKASWSLLQEVPVACTFPRVSKQVFSCDPI